MPAVAFLPESILFSFRGQHLNKRCYYHKFGCNWLPFP